MRLVGVILLLIALVLCVRSIKRAVILRLAALDRAHRRERIASVKPEETFPQPKRYIDPGLQAQQRLTQLNRRALDMDETYLGPEVHTQGVGVEAFRRDIDFMGQKRDTYATGGETFLLHVSSFNRQTGRLIGALYWTEGSVNKISGWLLNDTGDWILRFREVKRITGKYPIGMTYRLFLNPAKDAFEGECKLNVGPSGKPDIQDIGDPGTGPDTAMMDPGQEKAWDALEEAPTPFNPFDPGPGPVTISLQPVHHGVKRIEAALDDFAKRLTSGHTYEGITSMGRFAIRLTSVDAKTGACTGRIKWVQPYPPTDPYSADTFYGAMNPIPRTPLPSGFVSQPKGLVHSIKGVLNCGQRSLAFTEIFTHFDVDERYECYYRLTYDFHGHLRGTVHVYSVSGRPDGVVPNPTHLYYGVDVDLTKPVDNK